MFLEGQSRTLGCAVLEMGEDITVVSIFFVGSELKGRDDIMSGAVESRGEIM